MKKVIFALVILAIIIYAAYLVAIPHYNYYAFKSDLTAQLKVSIGKPEETMKEVMNLVEKYDIPIEEKDIILRRDKYYYVITSWTVTVDFFTLYQKTFKFYIDTRKK